MNRSALAVGLVWLLFAPGAATAITAEDLLGRETQITMQEAVLLALENNLQLDISRTVPAIADQQLRGSLGLYDPTFDASWTYEDVEFPTVNALISGDPGTQRTVESESWTYNAGLSGILPYGISYSSVWNTARTDSNDTRPIRTPRAVCRIRTFSPCLKTARAGYGLGPSKAG